MLSAGQRVEVTYYEGTDQVTRYGEVFHYKDGLLEIAGSHGRGAEVFNLHSLGVVRVKVVG